MSTRAGGCHTVVMNGAPGLSTRRTSRQTLSTSGVNMRTYVPTQASKVPSLSLIHI